MKGAFSYLKRLRSQRGYLWPINAEQQVRPQQVRKPYRFSEKITFQWYLVKVPCQPTCSTGSERNGAKHGGVLYVDSLSAADGPCTNLY